MPLRGNTDLPSKEPSMTLQGDGRFGRWSSPTRDYIYVPHRKSCAMTSPRYSVTAPLHHDPHGPGG